MSKNKVWSLPVRCLHWSLVAGIAAAWFTSSRTGAAHEYIGYGVAAIVVLRTVLGFGGGGRYARFAQFLRGPKHVLDYLAAAVRSRAPRYLGHNPLGGWMVVTLLATIATVTLTGWIATTDEFWGYAWPVRLHTGLAWTLVALIALHVAGVIFSSWQHAENLAASMISGTKDHAQPGDVD